MTEAAEKTREGRRELPMFVDTTLGVEFPYEFYQFERTKSGGAQWKKRSIRRVIAFQTLFFLALIALMSVTLTLFNAKSGSVLAADAILFVLLCVCVPLVTAFLYKKRPLPEMLVDYDAKARVAFFYGSGLTLKTDNIISFDVLIGNELSDGHKRYYSEEAAVQAFVGFVDSGGTPKREPVFFSVTGKGASLKALVKKLAKAMGKPYATSRGYGYAEAYKHCGFGGADLTDKTDKGVTLF